MKPEDSRMTLLVNDVNYGFICSCLWIFVGIMCCTDIIVIMWGVCNNWNGPETWRLTENNNRRVEATEMDALRRSSRISRKTIRNITIRQQIGLEETIVKEIEQNQLTWYGHVQRMVEGSLPKIALKWMPKQKRARGRPKKKTGWKV